MRTPKELDEAAGSFFRRHYQGCVDNGSLTDDTIDSFILVCRLHSLIVRCDPDTDSKAAMKFASLLKYYSTLAKPFGLLGSKAPAGKPKASITDILKTRLPSAL